MLKRFVTLLVFAFCAIIILFDIHVREWNYFLACSHPDSCFAKDSTRNTKNSAFVKKVDAPVFKGLNLEVDSVAQLLEITINIPDSDHLNLIIRDVEKERWEPPIDFPNPDFDSKKESIKIEESNFEFEYSFPLGIVIKRKQTGEIIFSLTDSFVISDLYVEFSFLIPSNVIYGLGERLGPFQFQQGTYTLFAVYREPGTYENGTPGNNKNGHHPIYLLKERSGKYHITLFRNVNPQELVLEDKRITWKAVGGVVDMHFFLGDEYPDTAVSKYHNYLGGWIVPPFWGLGYHQSRWGYKHIRMFEAVIKGFYDVELPLESIWSDIDYFLFNIDFLYKDWSFPGYLMAEKMTKRWVPVLHPYIPGPEMSSVYTYPNVIDLALKNSEDKKVNRVNIYGNIFFVDFTHPSANDFWKKMVSYLYSKWKFDGIWLNKNEIHDPCHQYKDILLCNPEDDKHKKYYKLPFYPGGKNFYDLPMVAIDSKHDDGNEELNVRSLMTIKQQKFSYEGVRVNTQLPMVLSRATIFGSGRYAFHWVADTKSDWKDLRYSIASIFNFNIFGIPFSGADICGFYSVEQADPELCARWHQLGAFYPFSRNHHTKERGKVNSQEPYAFTGVYFEAIASSIRLRYKMIRYYYHLYFLHSTKNQNRLGTIFRPLFFEFPHDHQLQNYGDKIIEQQIMIGNSIMVAPVLYPDLESLRVYFPESTWYDMRTRLKIMARANFQTVSASLNELTPYFVRGGSIIYEQEIKHVWSTEDLSNKIQLIVALNSSESLTKSSGYFLNVDKHQDFKVRMECVEKNCMMKIDSTFIKNQDSFRLKLEVNALDDSQKIMKDFIKFNELHILGDAQIFNKVSKVQINNFQHVRVTFNKVTENCLKLSFYSQSLHHLANYDFEFIY